MTKTYSFINISKTVDKKAIFRRAWQIARGGVKRFGGKVSEYFAYSLKEAWAEAKNAIKVSIPDWFMRKNNNFESTHCKCNPHFGLADVAKETEKSVLVKLPMVTKDGGYKTKFVKTVWIPKSILA